MSEAASEYIGPHTWMTDKRNASAYVISEGKFTYHLKATPDRPGGSRYVLRCYELPDWSGLCAYAGGDPRDNAVFQFLWQTQEIRGARDLLSLAPNKPE